jgi:hypothetical protein
MILRSIMGRGQLIRGHLSKKKICSFLLMSQNYDISRFMRIL